MCTCTVEPPNNGHVGDRHFHREIVLSLEVIIGRGNFGTLKCVLYRGFFLLCRLFGVSFMGGSTVLIFAMRTSEQCMHT